MQRQQHVAENSSHFSPLRGCIRAHRPPPPLPPLRSHELLPGALGLSERAN